jgi:hypothetical protein
MRGSTDPSELEQRLRESGGQTARAQITATKPGKALKSDDPAYGGVPQVVWKVTLRVSPSGRSPFNAVLKVPYPQKGGGPPVGSAVGVLYDPHDPTKLVIDHSAETESWGSVQAATSDRILAQSSGAAGLVIAGGQVISPAAAAGPPSVADQLAKLADLKNQGVLTESEFQAQKEKLLGT